MKKAKFLLVVAFAIGSFQAQANQQGTEGFYLSAAVDEVEEDVLERGQQKTWTCSFSNDFWLFHFALKDSQYQFQTKGYILVNCTRGKYLRVFSAHLRLRGVFIDPPDARLQMTNNEFQQLITNPGEVQGVGFGDIHNPEEIFGSYSIQTVGGAAPSGASTTVNWLANSHSGSGVGFQISLMTSQRVSIGNTIEVVLEPAYQRKQNQ